MTDHIASRSCFSSGCAPFPKNNNKKLLQTDKSQNKEKTRKTHSYRNVMTPGTYNDLANVAAGLEKFSEKAVVARVHLVVGNLVACLTFGKFRRAKELITHQNQNSSWKRFSHGCCIEEI